MPTTEPAANVNPPVPYPASEIGRLNNQVASLQEENAALKREVATLRQEVNRLRREVGEEIPDW